MTNPTYKLEETLQYLMTANIETYYANSPFARNELLDTAVTSILNAYSSEGNITANVETNTNLSLLGPYVYLAPYLLRGAHRQIFVVDNVVSANLLKMALDSLKVVEGEHYIVLIMDQASENVSWIRWDLAPKQLFEKSLGELGLESKAFRYGISILAPQFFMNAEEGNPESNIYEDALNGLITGVKELEGEDQFTGFAYNIVYTPSVVGKGLVAQLADSMKVVLLPVNESFHKNPETEEMTINFSDIFLNINFPTVEDVEESDKALNAVKDMAEPPTEEAPTEEKE